MLLVNIDALNVIYKETVRCFCGSRFVFIKAISVYLHVASLLCTQATHASILPNTANCERLKGIVFIILHSRVAITSRLRSAVRLNC